MEIRQPELYPTIDILVAGQPLPHGSPLERSLLHAEDVRSLAEADGAIGIVSGLVEVRFGIRGHRDAGAEIGVQATDRSPILNRGAAREAFYQRRVEDHVGQRRDGRARDAIFAREFTDTPPGAARSAGYPRAQRSSASAVHPSPREVPQPLIRGELVYTLPIDERRACQMVS
jgi:hypothetical protein